MTGSSKRNYYCIRYFALYVVLHGVTVHASHTHGYTPIVDVDITWAIDEIQNIIL